MEPEQENFALKDQMDYAMRHFTFIADQRLKTFNFYAILLAASIGGVIHVAARESVSAPVFLAAGIFNMILPIIFFIIERRNLHLLYVVRQGIESIERHPRWPKQVRLALKDRELTRPIRKKFFSYRIAFALAYGLQLMMGLALIACALFAPLSGSPAGSISGRSIQTNKAAKPSVPNKKATKQSTSTPKEGVAEPSSY